MAPFTGNQIRRGNRGRTVLSVVLLAWLINAVQPCVMAMEMSPEPAAGMDVAMVSHAGHASQDESSRAHQCARCPAADTWNSDVCQSAIQADCDNSPDYKKDGRTSKLNLEDVDQALNFFVPRDYQPTHRLISASWFPQSNKPIRPSGPSLDILFCRFLK